MRKSFYFALSFFAAGMFFSANIFSKSLILVLILTFSLIYAIKKKEYYPFIAGIIFLLVGFVSYSMVYNHKISAVDEFIGKNSSITLKICDDGYENTSYVKYTAKIKDINNKKQNIKVLVTFPKNHTYSYGDVLTLKDVKLKIPHEALSKNDFDYRMYLKAKGVFVTMYADTINIENKEEGKGIIRSLYSLKGKINEKLSLHLKGDQKHIASAIITGDKSGITPKIKKDFKKSGLSHLLAVSGLHLTLIVSYLGCFFKKKSYIIQRYVKPIFSIIITLCAMIVTGFGFSVIRAGIMLIIYNAAKLLGREKSSINSLMVAAGIIVILNPYSVFDIGFEFSFFATLGILLFSEILNKFLVSKLKFKYLCSLVSTTVCAQIFTVPIAILYYNTFSVYAVFANVLAVPVFTVLLMCVIAFVLVLFICPFIPFVIKIFAGNIYIFTKLVLIIAAFVAKLPFSFVAINNIKFSIILCFVFAICLSIIAIKKYNKKVIAYSLIIFCIFGIFYVNYNPENLEVTYLDVGQGACSYISMPNGDNVLVDCGISKYYSNEDIGYKVENYLTKNSVDVIDYAILTHYHDDHYSGFFTLMEKQIIKTMVLPKIYGDEEEKSYMELKECAQENNVDIIYFKRGALLNFDDAKIYAISPLLEDDLSTNDESLVIKLVYKDAGFLFTGDIEDEVMRKLKPEELSANVITSPHHGSNTSVYEEFYKATGADYSVISVGEDNSYKHPHKEHLEVLSKNNIDFFRTDINKNIYFKVDKNGNIKYKFEEGRMNEGA